VAKVLSVSHQADLALLEVEDKRFFHGITPLKLGKLPNIEQEIAVYGFPMGGNTLSATTGIVSRIEHQRYVHSGESFLSIQVDAAVNPGNSGGPLCDIHGKVIGINTAIVKNAQGLGFAVPINIARKVMEDFLKYGKVIRGWLGIYIEDVSPEVAEKFGVKRGVVVTKVMKDSPAEKGGLKDGDIIVEFNHTPVKGVADLQLKVINTKPGTVVEIKIIRDGEEKTLKVKVGQMPGAERVAVESLMSKYGFSVQELTEDLRRRLGIPRWVKEGVIVTQVKPGSPADYAGLREGDVIVKAGPRTLKKIKSVSDLLSVVKSAGESGIVLKVVRGEGVFLVVLKPEE